MKGESRRILGLITFLGFRGEKVTLLFAIRFIQKFSIWSQDCPHRHWCETGSIKLKVRSCSPAAQQNIDTGGTGSVLKPQLCSVSEKLSGTDASSVAKTSWLGKLLSSRKHLNYTNLQL